MLKQFPLALLLVALFLGCGERRTQAPQAKIDDPTFTFDSVEYSTGGTPKTSRFTNEMVQMHANAVKSDITILGSYSPGEPKVNAIDVYFYTDLVVSVAQNSTMVSGQPPLKRTNWEPTRCTPSSPT